MLLKNLATDRCRIRRCALIVFRDIKPLVKKTGPEPVLMPQACLRLISGTMQMQTTLKRCPIPHLDVDPAIINSDREEFIQAYLVVDGCPNDYISEKFVTAGVANNRSIQIPSLIQAALNRRKAGMIGEGENIRLNVQTQTSMTYIHNSKHVVAKALHDAVSSNHSPGHWS